MDTNENTSSQTPDGVVDQIVLTLRKPAKTRDGKSVTELKLREPTAIELDAASRSLSGVGALMSLIAATAQVPPQVPNAMCSRDLAEADAFFNSFRLPPPDDVDADDFIDEYKLTLRKPVTLGKGADAVVYEELVLTEPTGADKDKAGRVASDTLAAIVLIAAVAKVPRLVVERLCRRDFEEACNFLGSCNVTGQPTGGTPLLK